jgi:hypothetical protein
LLYVTIFTNVWVPNEGVVLKANKIVCQAIIPWWGSWGLWNIWWWDRSIKRCHWGSPCHLRNPSSLLTEIYVVRKSTCSIEWFSLCINQLNLLVFQLCLHYDKNFIILLVSYSTYIDNLINVCFSYLTTFVYKLLIRTILT